MLTEDVGSLDFAQIVRPGDTVMWSQGAAEPLSLIERLLEQRHRIGPFRVFVAGSYSGALRPEHCDIVSVSGMGAVGANRALCAAGLMDVIPCHVSELSRLLVSRELRVDVALVQLAEGTSGLSWGPTHPFVAQALDGAREVIVELNAAAPATRSSRNPSFAFRRSVRVDRPLPSIGRAAPNETELRVAERAATFVENGATLQMGIGGAPGAVPDFLGDRRSLGVHSGVIGDAAVDLIERGVVDNSCKSVDSGVTVTNALAGTDKLYGFAHDNEAIRLEPVSHTHNHSVLASMSRLCAINSTIEVDLTGQAASEIAGRRYLGTIGGQVDFVRGALASPGGVSIIALPSRASSGTPRIVVRLSSGIATVGRADADIVVTEHGSARLRGCGLRERVRRMIAIAHPEDRENLEREARDAVVGY